MVIMALDHSRGFFSNATFYPLDLERTNVSLWLYGTPPGPNSPPISVPADRGFDLPVVYLVWILVVLLLYPVCKWFDGLKRRRREAWLSYL